MTYEEALSKAVKCLRLAQSSNPHEAALAAARAQEIIDRYKIETIALDLAGPDKPDEPIKDFGGDLLDAGRPVDTWRWRLFHHVAEVNGCEGYLKPGRGMAIVGRPNDATTVRYVYAWLKQEVERLRERDCKGFSHVYQNNYRNGVVDTIGQKLAAQQEETRARVRQEAQQLGQGVNALALVRVNQALAKIERQREEVERWMGTNLKLRKGSGSSAKYDPSARELGQKAGHEVRFTKSKGSIGGGQ